MAELIFKDDNGETYKRTFNADLLNLVIYNMLEIIGEATYMTDVSVNIHNPVFGDQSYKLVVDAESDSSEPVWGIVESEDNPIRLEQMR